MVIPGIYTIIPYVSAIRQMIELITHGKALIVHLPRNGNITYGVGEHLLGKTGRPASKSPCELAI